jgi:vacuolar-type H+-ATPase subunit E/Vma4
MVTVEQKLRSFEEEIMNKIEEEANKKLSSSRSENADFYQKKREEIEKECDRIIQQMKGKSQTERQHILSKAGMDKQSVVLRKRREILDRAFEDIFSMAEEFTGKKEYEDFLLKSIDKSIAEFRDKNLNLYVRHIDIQNLGQRIDEHLEGYRSQGYIINVTSTDEDIIGGCIAENESKKRRADCTLRALLDESKPLIGREVSKVLEGSILEKGR